MYLPFVNPSTQKTRRQVVQFGGLNRTQDFRDGELVDSAGLSTREWPCLAQRLGRKKLPAAFSSSLINLFAWDELVMCEYGKLYYGGERVGDLLLWPKKMAAVNTKLCIFPDKKYLEKDEDSKTMVLKDLEAKAVNQLEQPVVFTQDSLSFVKDESVKFKSYNMIAQARKSTTPANVTCYTYHLKVYDSVRWDVETGSWETTGEEVINLYYLRNPEDLSYLQGKYIILTDGEDGYAEANFKKVAMNAGGVSETEEDYRQDSEGKYGVITGMDIEILDGNYYGQYNATGVTLHVDAYDGAQPNDSLGVFQAGDVVTISGCEKYTANNVDIRVVAVEDTKITFDSPVLTAGDESGKVTVERKVPDLSFICESGNRLVGVSNQDKTIYISALGDPRNFYDYRGLSVSSSYIPVGSRGDFTGCIAYGGNVLVFKEDCIIRLMGDYDGNYAIYTDQVAGVQAGCEASMVIINDVLYYKGRDGVYAYTGSTPRLISAALGDVPYNAARAGTDGQRYYISMMREDEDTEKWELLVYDTRTGLWMKEENRRVDAFANQDGQLYMASMDGLYVLGNTEKDQEQGEAEETKETPIPWEATFTPFDETTHGRKYPSRLLLRLELEAGAWVEAELARDGGPFQHIWTGQGGTQGPTAVIPIRPGRCDRYQLRLKGEGRCLIRSMAREFSVGGVR